MTQIGMSNETNDSDEPSLLPEITQNDDKKPVLVVPGLAKELKRIEKHYK